MMGGVVCTSGAIHKAHQNSQEVLGETWVSFVTYEPMGKAALTITKWQLLSLQIPCFTTSWGLF